MDFDIFVGKMGPNTNDYADSMKLRNMGPLGPERRVCRYHSILVHCLSFDIPPGLFETCVRPPC